MTALAISLEALQYFIPLRRFNWYDMAANLTGLAIGALAAFLVSRLSRGNPTSSG